MRLARIWHCSPLVWLDDPRLMMTAIRQLEDDAAEAARRQRRAARGR